VLDVSLVALESKDVPVVVSIEGEPAEGYTLGAPDTGETEVTVSGPLDKIALVTQAAGTINVEGAPNPSTRPCASSPVTTWGTSSRS